jgi:Long-chain acyl-CoA synthetases (AMP-forming)
VLGPDDVVYLFLPLAHVFAQVIALGSAGTGAVLAYCSGDAAAIMPDLQALSPTVVPSVPRIFEKVYAGVSGMVPAEMRAQAVAVGLAVRRMEQAGQPVPEYLRAGFEQADAQLFSKVRAVFGGRLRQAISGAAPIAPEILEFFHAAGVPVYEGYGLSESTAIGTLNTADALRIGAVDDAGFVTITGRKKDIIITAGGKNLSPNNVENDLRGFRWISQAVMRPQALPRRPDHPRRRGGGAVGAGRGPARRHPPRSSRSWTTTCRSRPASSLRR